ncbi:non-specific lipid transfer protein GPI-anchored 30-like [Diospyros lotus]|uniref:non-specific lipid transfer protein GPI-anchored 30-like n=1 Tax=Diospyros lotus TaxID=55363 RepID=UPI00225AB1E9|nr:non-specific lipid transfer protein GPI-anchored 30-like [Diospyros lotus]
MGLMGIRCTWFGVVVLAMNIFIMAEYLSLAQETSSSSSCIDRLRPCFRYLNSEGDPPDSCCDPLKWVIKSDPECLCSMISIRGTRQAEQAGINVTQAQQLPGRCGQHVNPISSCLTGSNNSNSGNSSERGASSSSSSSSLMSCGRSRVAAIFMALAVSICRVLTMNSVFG